MCSLSEANVNGMGCDDVFCRLLYDLEAATWGFRVRAAGRKASAVCVTLSMEGAQAVFGAVRLNFEVVGDGFAFRSVAKDHFVFGVFELKATQHTEW